MKEGIGKSETARGDPAGKMNLSSAAERLPGAGVFVRNAFR